MKNTGTKSVFYLNSHNFHKLNFPRLYMKWPVCLLVASTKALKALISVVISTCSKVIYNRSSETLHICKKLVQQ